jgi:hypothetical protein
MVEGHNVSHKAAIGWPLSISPWLVLDAEGVELSACGI